MRWNRLSNRRRVFAAFATVALIACEDLPTQPTMAEVQFLSLLDAPAWAVSEARAAEFSAALLPYAEGLERTGVEVFRTQDAWRAAWDRENATWLSSRPVVPVDFANEMVISVGDFGRVEMTIDHVTRHRDTTFVLVTHTTYCHTGQQGLSYSSVLRLVPATQDPLRFLFARRIMNCATGRFRTHYGS